MITLETDRLNAAYRTALDALLKERHPNGYWVGELSNSALSTATAVMALHMVQNKQGHAAHQALIDGGLQWLADHQNEDGGWGDTVKSFSNISTTMLCRATFHLTQTNSRFAPVLSRTEQWLFSRYGNTPEQLSEAVRQRYGKDRTFATPILTTCALAGLVAWREVPPLPFELAVFPQSWFRFFRLHVVSYALPALIGIGLCIYHHKKPWNPFSLVFRWLARRRSLKVLERIQPENGGFLEATPLTSFVTLSLAACGLANHHVTERGAAFLVSSVRPDGSWPIDTNLSTWVTTLAINGLASAGELENLEEKEKVHDWLVDQQYQERHPYTGAAPGGWGWTPLPGSVPDADDTPGALLALSKLVGDFENPIWRRGDRVLFAHDGIEWLLGLQNRDGGWPTFCRGWGNLPFDRSGSDLTAHVLRAFKPFGLVWENWDKELTELKNDSSVFVDWTSQTSNRKFLQSTERGFNYLTSTQRPDGSWLPLWFGCQHAEDDVNPTYGTTRVLAAYRDLGKMNDQPAQRGLAWLLAAQNQDGGWGGDRGCPSSIEETALAVEVLVDAAAAPDHPAGAAVNNGLTWLVQQIEQGNLSHPTPIGFYFAKLWYFEMLYPIIFSVAALGRARRLLMKL